MRGNGIPLQAISRYQSFTITRDPIHLLPLHDQVERVVEEVPHEFHEIGQEYHAEVEQFGSGGIPVSASRPAPAVPDPSKPKPKPDLPTVGGVKRRKSRRSRRS